MRELDTSCSGAQILARDHLGRWLRCRHEPVTAEFNLRNLPPRRFSRPTRCPCRRCDLQQGGNAVDAAIATNAAIAVTCPHLSGHGGDPFALIHDGHLVHALNSSGRAGSGANADQLRAEGLTTLPFRHDIRVVTMPGCIDGWVALNERFGSMPLAEVIQPAIDLAEYGFASPLLVGAVRQLIAEVPRHRTNCRRRRRVSVVRRPGVAPSTPSSGIRRT